MTESALRKTLITVIISVYLQPYLIFTRNSTTRAAVSAFTVRKLKKRKKRKIWFEEKALRTIEQRHLYEKATTV